MNRNEGQSDRKDAFKTLSDKGPFGLDNATSIIYITMAKGKLTIAAGFKIIGALYNLSVKLLPPGIRNNDQDQN